MGAVACIVAHRTSIEAPPPPPALSVTMPNCSSSALLPLQLQRIHIYHAPSMPPHPARPTPSRSRSNQTEMRTCHRAYVSRAGGSISCLPRCRAVWLSARGVIFIIIIICVHL